MLGTVQMLYILLTIKSWAKDVVTHVNGPTSANQNLTPKLTAVSAPNPTLRMEPLTSQYEFPGQHQEIY